MPRAARRTSITQFHARRYSMIVLAVHVIRPFDSGGGTFPILTYRRIVRASTPYRWAT